MCYIHCWDKPFPDEPEMASSRFEPEPKRFCQVQCWRNSKKTKNVPLFGLDVLLNDNQWDITLMDVLVGSYKTWEGNRYQNLIPFLALDDRKENGQLKFGAAIPVCLSSMQPHNFHTRTIRIMHCHASVVTHLETRQYRFQRDPYTGLDSLSKGHTAC